MRRFYLAFPIGHAVRDQLAWTHYRTLSRVADNEARLWHEIEMQKQFYDEQHGTGEE